MPTEMLLGTRGGRKGVFKMAELVYKIGNSSLIYSHTGLTSRCKERADVMKVLSENLANVLLKETTSLSHMHEFQPT